MATLDFLKTTLRQKVLAAASAQTQPLSDLQYNDGFEVLRKTSERLTYQDFIIPQLSLLLATLCDSLGCVSVLEVGPGPESVLGCVPDYLRRKVKKYTAFEPNSLFATKLKAWLCSTSETGSPLPCLESSPDIRRSPFVLNTDTRIVPGTASMDSAERFDVVLFCHSMYGMKPKHRFIRQALQMLPERSGGEMVVVFHRGRALHLDGLTCCRTASFPTGVVRVADDDEILDRFAPFIAGLVLQDIVADKAIRVEWRKTCRTLGLREKAHPNHLLFSSPNIMAAFTQHATTLPALTAQIPVVIGDKSMKNREARLHHPASIVRPTEIVHVQKCVRWALDHGHSLTVVGGGHSGHCLWPNVVSVDMSAFDQIHIPTAGQRGVTCGSDSDTLVLVEAGCKSGDIVRKTMAAGLTVPQGGRPSVGAGLWLQGGIGHLARLRGLTCDAIVGAVVVSVASGQVLCVGRVPNQHRPAGSVRPDNDAEWLWAIRGAGTNFGIVISVTFKAYVAPIYTVRNWIIPLSDDLDARIRLSYIEESIAGKLPRNCSVDAYLYWEMDKLHLGVVMFECSTTGFTDETPTSKPMPVCTILGPESSSKVVDGIGLFDTEMYMSGMHGEHGTGKTSSFKRCVFMKSVGTGDVVENLVAAIETRPSPLCYLHLLQGGGAVGDVVDNATAFGCRDWGFACVVTGVWPRDQDETEVARAAVQWVYETVEKLLPFSSGVYGADLGPDPRDAQLAVKAFGTNLSRLASLKRRLDPGNVLAYACPLPKAPIRHKLIILVTGESCAGKDYCAEIWVSVLSTRSQPKLRARAVSISDAIKRDYAESTGADLERLLRDRVYKEQHRPALSTYFQQQVRLRPQLPREHFMRVLRESEDMDVLLITGMRDEAPVAAFSHLAPDSRLLEVRVKAGKETRRAHRGYEGSTEGEDKEREGMASNAHPGLVFHNDTPGDEAAIQFCLRSLLPFFHEDLRRLADMVRSVPNFPRPGIEFRDVLGIAQQAGGLGLATSLLQSFFTGDWAQVDAVVCCETGGFIYASALATRIDVPLVLVREEGKLPPPTISVSKPPSYISSSSTFENAREKRIEMGKDVIPTGASVVVLDDVLATGETLCAVLQLLGKAGIEAGDVNVLVVAEFPDHRGRELLRERGFGRVRVQSLLIFRGA